MTWVLSSNPLEESLLTTTPLSRWTVFTFLLCYSVTVFYIPRPDMFVCLQERLVLKYNQIHDLYLRLYIKEKDPYL